MKKAPSLAFLCVQTIKLQLLGGDNPTPEIYELPSDLFDGLVSQLPALALQNLQTNMPFKSWDDSEFADDCLKKGRKRGRNGKFPGAWKTLFELRWPWLVDHVKKDDWQELYWETHLQDCLDEAAEVALLPTFGGRLGCIKISDKMLSYICHEEHKNCQNCECKEISYHFEKFGSYARCLRLMNVHCVAETCELLRTSKLENLALRWIRSREYMEPLCKLLIQNRQSLTSLEFIHCKLSLSFINAICASLHQEDIQTKGIKHFSIKTCVVEMDLAALPSAFVSFLRSGRSLYSLNLCDNYLDMHFARMVFSTLLDSNSNLSSLDLSENNITGWLSTFDWRSTGYLSTKKSLCSLHVLNLRRNNLGEDDAENLGHALFHMPNLATLDLSDNPIGYAGVRSLVLYLLEASKRSHPLTDLILENCELCESGVTELLDTLTILEKPLKSLSIADNTIDSRRVADAIVNFLESPIQSLNISGIGLGPVGFFELQRRLVNKLKLVNINISKNSGGLEAASFLSKLILLAPEIVSVNASYNLMPGESWSIICSSLKITKGNLECIDMRGNSSPLGTACASNVRAFQRNGKPMFILSSFPARNVPYDDDP